MNRILIHMTIIENGEYDIFSNTKIEDLKKVISETYKGNFPNMGNKLWFQAIISEIDDGENIIEYYDKSMTYDYINTHYDMIIAPMANIFAKYYVQTLNDLADRFDNIKIPTYVIACGAQAKSKEDLDELCEALRPSAIRFISSIYNTGGEFALRGHFTKEFFDRLMPNTAVVTGCPSLFQCDPNLNITNPSINNNVKIAVNGDMNILKKSLKKYKDSEFFDQHVYYHLLYGNDLNKKLTIKDYLRLVKIYGYQALKAVLNNKVVLKSDMVEWREYLRRNNFTVSIGTRIHGSVMAVLAGVPAIMCAIDTRTEEMADYYGIPYLCPEEFYKLTIEEIISKIDYSQFNETYNIKHKFFEEFLLNHGIVKNIGINSFFERIKYEETPLHTINNIDQLKLQFNTFKFILFVCDKIWHRKR